MIDYSFWVKDKVEGVEAMVYSSHMDQTTFSSRTVLEQIVGEFPENSKATRKAIALPDPVLENQIVYNGKSGGRQYLTEVQYTDGTFWTDLNKVVGVYSIPYPVDRKPEKVTVWEYKTAKDKKQVLELAL